MPTGNVAVRGSFTQINNKFASVHGTVLMVLTDFPKELLTNCPTGDFSLIVVITKQNRLHTLFTSDNKIISPKELNDLDLEGKEVEISQNTMLVKGN